jgi:hypothetical protein
MVSGAQPHLDELPKMTLVVGARLRFETCVFGLWTFKPCIAEARADDPRQGIELMEWRRRRQGPFQRSGAATPGIGACCRTQTGSRQNGIS